jgi:hypothetical protein
MTHFLGNKPLGESLIDQQKTGQICFFALVFRRKEMVWENLNVG